MAYFETFALEEYKAIQTRINNYRDHVTRLETFTIGGVVVVVGILLGLGPKTSHEVPLKAWLAFIFIVVAAGLRCWAYYLYLWHLRSYVMQIEKQMHSAGYELVGVETFNEGKWLLCFYIVMGLMWAGLIGGLIILAILK